MVNFPLGGHMYLIIVSCIMYLNSDYFKFDRVGVSIKIKYFMRRLGEM
jgi:hypothetical protein